MGGSSITKFVALDCETSGMSFTSDDPSRRGKADAERQAAEFQQDRDTNVSRKRQKNGNILLKDAMKKLYEMVDRESNKQIVTVD